MKTSKLLAVLLLCLAAPLGAEGIKFREVSKDWGIDFRHHHGGSGQRYMLETVVGGVVMFDFDGDGDEDLFFVDGGSLPGYTGEPARSRLFRNDGNGHFTDWTEKSGIKVTTYGVRRHGRRRRRRRRSRPLRHRLRRPNQLFRNNGDGTFTDVTAKAGVGDPLWSASAAFADVDNDGDLDLWSSTTWTSR